MQQMSDYSFAMLHPDLLSKVSELEQELSAELDGHIVLLAYDEKRQPSKSEGDTRRGH